MAYFPEPAELSAGIGEAARARAANWDRLMEVRDAFEEPGRGPQREADRRAPGSARTPHADGSLYPLLEEYARELPALFIVSQVEIARAADGPLAVEVERAAGRKCERCWKYTTDVGSDEGFPGICGPAPAPSQRPPWLTAPQALRRCGGCIRAGPSHQVVHRYHVSFADTYKVIRGSSTLCIRRTAHGVRLVRRFHV